MIVNVVCYVNSVLACNSLPYNNYIRKFHTRKSQMLTVTNLTEVCRMGIPQETDKNVHSVITGSVSGGSPIAFSV